MKSNYVKVSLALLSAVFILGCQDVGTGPDGLVPQLDKPGEPGTPTCPGGADRDGKGHCHDDEETPTGEGLHIAVCCSQNRFSGNPVEQIAEALGASYSTLKAKQFNEMSITDLAKIDVLIFFWKTSDNVNADWDMRLLPYMDAGGGIIFEDPNNVGDLATGVSILGGSGSGSGPITVTIASIDGLTTGTVPYDFIDGDDMSADSTFTNNHIIFAEPGPFDALQPFLTLKTGTDEWVVGLYGEFDPTPDDDLGLSGRIVLTGLDNGWHGRLGGSTEQDNHYKLLFNEICWVLSGC